jgi:hypothetical protein
VAASDGPTLIVPAGAVTGDTAFTIEQAKAAPAPTGVAVTPVYAFGPDGAQFAKPVMVELPFDATKLPSGKTAADIRIYTAATGSSTYAALPTTVSDASHVRAATTHFSVFSAAVSSSDVTNPNSDMAQSTIASDMAAAGDLASGNCVPNCTAGYSNCGCTGTCLGKSYLMRCNPSTSGYSCYCEINGQTQANMGNIVMCDASTLLSEFSTLCNFPAN